MGDFKSVIFAISYILQAVGSIGIAYAWWRSLVEWRMGKRVPRTRFLLLMITSVALISYILPTLIAMCYFIEGCFRPFYRDVLRVTSGLILFLFGVFEFLLYYTKEDNG